MLLPFLSLLQFFFSLFRPRRCKPSFFYLRTEKLCNVRRKVDTGKRTGKVSVRKLNNCLFKQTAKITNNHHHVQIMNTYYIHIPPHTNTHTRNVHKHKYLHIYTNRIHRRLTDRYTDKLLPINLCDYMPVLLRPAAFLDPPSPKGSQVRKTGSLQGHFAGNIVHMQVAFLKKKKRGL